MRVSLAALVQTYTKVLCAGKGLWRAEWRGIGTTRWPVLAPTCRARRSPALPGTLAAGELGQRPVVLEKTSTLGGGTVNS